jgi:uncharacterized protein YcfJ
MSKRAQCPNCKCEHPISAQHAGKVAGVPIGAAIGRLVDKSPWAR